MHCWDYLLDHASQEWSELLKYRCRDAQQQMGTHRRKGGCWQGGPPCAFTQESALCPFSGDRLLAAEATLPLMSLLEGVHTTAQWLVLGWAIP
jgi:hypothetical protein